MIHAVIFDLDGVLIDSEPLIRYSFAQAYNRVVDDGPPPIDEYMTHMGDYFPNIMKHMGLPLSMWDAFREVSSNNLHMSCVFPGVISMLEHLAENGHQLGVYTGKDKTRTAEVLAHFKMASFFEIVVTPEYVKRPKPYPDGLLYALGKIKVATENAVYVGDAPHDMTCAREAGVKSIAALWGSMEPDRISRAADSKALSPNALVRTVQAYSETRGNNQFVGPT